MLDNVNYLGFDAAKPGGQGKYEGRFGQRQVDFIANVLNKFPPDKLVVACMHIPLQTYLDSANAEMNTSDRGDFFKLLQAARTPLACRGTPTPPSITISVSKAASRDRRRIITM